MRLRLIISFALVVVIAVVSFAIIVRVNTAQAVRTFMFRGGTAGVDALVLALERYYQRRGSWQGVEQNFKTFLESNAGRSFGMRGGRHEVDRQITQRLRLFDPQGELLLDTGGPNSGGRVGTETLEQAIPLEVENRIVGYLLTERRLQFTPAHEQILLTRLNRSALMAAIIAGVVALVLALLLAYRLLRPVQDLTQAATHMAEGDLSQRVPVHGDDQLATLGYTFNTMADSLEQAERRRKALTADIAHELRTPLAVQRAHLEALQDGIYDLTPENLAAIQEQNQVLTRLVEDLRTLALADAGELALERTPTDLAALLERFVARFSPQAGEADVNLDLALEESVLTRSLDPQRIEQILNNLLSNAIRYTPEGGTIYIRLFREGDDVLITVRDTGPGIPEDALPHLFDRFYKFDKSRSRHSGTGLGLSIARKLAQAHGGDLTACNHPRGGAVFTLRL
jgi:signal transduction histidine kinase